MAAMATIPEDTDVVLYPGCHVEWTRIRNTLSDPTLRIPFFRDASQAFSEEVFGQEDPLSQDLWSLVLEFSTQMVEREAETPFESFFMIGLSLNGKDRLNGEKWFLRHGLWIPYRWHFSDLRMVGERFRISIVGSYKMGWKTGDWTRRWELPENVLTTQTLLFKKGVQIAGPPDPTPEAHTMFHEDIFWLHTRRRDSPFKLVDAE